MDATIILRGFTGGRMPPRRKIETIAEVRFKVRNAPEALRVGDEIALRIFGNPEENEPPTIEGRRYVGNNLHIFCSAYPMILHKLAGRRGAKLKRKETRGFEELQYYELPTQKWV